MPMREVDQNDPPAEIRNGATTEAKGRKFSDEERRQSALGLAIQGSYANITEDTVIKRAKAFEAYLKTGA